MNKIKRYFALTIALIVIISSFSVTAFAEENQNVIDTDCFYAVIPDEYYPAYDDSGVSLVFQDDDYNTIKICRDENTSKGLKNGISKASEDDLKKFFIDFLGLNGEYDEVEFLKSDKTEINGLSCYITSGKYLDWFLCTEKEDAYYYDFCVCVFATKEYVYTVYFDEYCDEYSDIADFEEIREVLKTVAINGTYFEGENLANPHIFSNKTFEEAVKENSNTDFTDEDINALIVVLLIIFVIPVILLSIIAIVLIVKNRKRKKLIEKYEIKYGMLNAYNPSNYNGYNYNAGANNQSNSAPLYKSDIYNNYETHNPQEEKNTDSREPDNNESDI